MSHFIIISDFIVIIILTVLSCYYDTKSIITNYRKLFYPFSNSSYLTTTLSPTFPTLSFHLFSISLHSLSSLSTHNHYFLEFLITIFITFNSYKSNPNLTTIDFLSVLIATYAVT